MAKCHYQNLKMPTCSQRNLEVPIKIKSLLSNELFVGTLLELPHYTIQKWYIWLNFHTCRKIHEVIYFPVIYEISFSKSGNQLECIISESSSGGSPKSVPTKSSFDERDLVLVGIFLDFINNN